MSELNSNAGVLERIQLSREKCKRILHPVEEGLTLSEFLTELDEWAQTLPDK